MARRRFKFSRARRIGGSIINGTAYAFTKPIGNAFLLMGMAIGVFYFNNQTTLKTHLTKLGDTIAFLAPITKWLSERLAQTAGFIICGPAIFSATTAATALGYLALSGITIFALLQPATKYPEYVALAICSAAFLATRSVKVKIVVVLVVIGTIIGGLWGEELFKAKTAKS